MRETTGRVNPVACALLFFIIILLVWALFFQPVHGYRELSVLDLYRTEWNIYSTEIVGTYRGNLVRKNQFEVWKLRYVEDKDKEYFVESTKLTDVMSCSLVGNWMLLEGEKNKTYHSSFLSARSVSLRVLDGDRNVLVTIK